MNRLYNEDFRNIAVGGEFDVIITDPPYNIGFNYNTYKDSMEEDDYVEMLSYFQNQKLVIIQYPEETMQYIVPALGVPDEVMVWCYSSNIPRQSRLINFYNIKPDFTKVKMPYKNPEDKRVKKLIESGSGGRSMYDWFDDIQLVKNVSKDKNHPCPMPIRLMERLILLTTEEGNVVFDPFMGSGTTGLACKKLNRGFVGTEIDKKYFDIAVERIENTSYNLFRDSK